MSTKALTETALFFFTASGWDLGLLINAVAFALVMLQKVQVKAREFNSHTAQHAGISLEICQSIYYARNLLSIIDWARPASSERQEKDYKQYLLSTKGFHLETRREIHT